MKDEWTVSTLKEYFERVLREHDRIYDERFHSQEVDADKVARSVERRFQSMNEFRAQLADQTAQYIPRKEVDQLFRAMQERLELLTSLTERRSGQSSGMNQAWGYLISIATIIILALTIVYTKGVR